MNKLNLSLLLAAVFSVLLYATCRSNRAPLLQSENGVQFQITSLDSAKASALRSGKPLFVFVHATWCPTCKKMEHEVLVQKPVGEVYNTKFSNVAIDVDSPYGAKLKEQYPIRATPTLLYFNADGTLAKKWEGAAATDQLLSFAAGISFIPKHEQ